MDIQSSSNSSGLQIGNQTERAGYRGSDPLASLHDRVSSALDKMMAAGPGAGNGVSVDKVKEMISGIAGSPLPGMNQNILA